MPNPVSRFIEGVVEVAKTINANKRVLAGVFILITAVVGGIWPESEAWKICLGITGYLGGAGLNKSDRELSRERQVYGR